MNSAEKAEEWDRELTIHKDVYVDRLASADSITAKVTVLQAWITVTKQAYERTKKRTGEENKDFLCLIDKSERRVECERIGESYSSRSWRKSRLDRTEEER
jgi:hypothetical protein